MPATLAVARLCDAPSVIVLLAPVKLTVDELDVKEVAEEVFHDPAMPIAADANVIVAVPLDARSLLSVTVAPVRVSVPVNVRAEATVVVIPLFTVRLATVVGMFTEPPEVFTMTVDVPWVKAPEDVSMLLTVIELALATRVPPDPMVMVVAVIGKLAADVARDVVEAPSLTWRVVAFRPRDASVKVWAVPAEEVKTAVANSGQFRFVPAKVIVPPVAEVKVTVALPGVHELLVEALVHVPATVHASEPNTM